VNRFVKNFDDLSLNFNDLFEILSEMNLQSYIKNTSVNQDQVLKSTFVVQNVHIHKYFENIINKIINFYQLKNTKIDVDLFISVLQGNSGPVHVDDHDVVLYNLHGETMYIVDREKFTLETGDLLHIKTGQIHQSISLKPRITFSLGVRNEKE
tara:strand:+ start:69 stop:527 length:459 start_codon:yes stop_codon:yes gene_type:complete